MQRISKLWVVLALILVVGGGGYWFASQKRAALERQIVQEKEQQYAEFKRKRKELRRKLRELPEEQHFTFSPDSRFLAGHVGYSPDSVIAIWPISGGKALVRHPFGLTETPSLFWKDETHLVINDEVWHLRNVAGKWNLNKVGLFYPNGHGVDQAVIVKHGEDYPHLDIRIHAETISRSNTPPQRKWAVYGLNSGKKINLPVELERNVRGTPIAPLTDGKKLPLRIATWQDRGPGSDPQIDGESKLEVWDVTAGKRLWAKPQPIRANFLKRGDEGRLLIVIGAPRKLPPEEAKPGTIYSYDGKVSNIPPDSGWDTDGIDVYDVITGKLLAQKDVPRTQRYGYGVSTDGKLLALQVRSNPKSLQQELIIHDARDLRVVKRIPITSSHGFHLVFSGDNRYLLARNNGILHIYDWQRTDAKGKTPFQQATL